MADPFLQVQSDVLSQLSHTRSLHKSFLRIRSLHPPNPPTTTNSKSSNSTPELIAAHADLSEALATLTEDISDLSASVAAIERAPASYKVSREETVRRKRFIEDVGREVASMRGALVGEGGGGSDNNRYGNSHSHTSANGNANDPITFASEEDDDSYAAYEQAQQTQILHSQETQLDSVFLTVGNLRTQADEMGRELEEQREMLEVVDGVADRVGGKLKTGMERLAVVARRNEDRWSGLCIWVLVFVLVVLLVLLLIV